MENRTKEEIARENTTIKFGIKRKKEEIKACHRTIAGLKLDIEEMEQQVKDNLLSIMRLGDASSS